MTTALGIRLALVGEGGVGAEDALVARLRQGDLQALADAYDAHHVHVRAFARRLVGDDGAAEDLVQETFLALPRAVIRFRGGASLRTLLVSVAINHARHHLRAAVRRRAAMRRLACEPQIASPTPDRDAERAQLAATLVRALDTLPIEQRVAIVLCEVEERTSSEVALITNVPEGTVRTRVLHAKRRLIEALAKEGVQ
jgi:RNA polymerase sigma-70 factor (ECF subfamily)